MKLPCNLYTSNDIIGNIITNDITNITYNIYILVIVNYYSITLQMAPLRSLIDLISDFRPGVPRLVLPRNVAQMFPRHEMRYVLRDLLEEPVARLAPMHALVQHRC